MREIRENLPDFRDPKQRGLRSWSRSEEEKVVEAQGVTSAGAKKGTKICLVRRNCAAKIR